ncbi:MAG TPA: hypothetical protein VFV96_03590 [Verrucomicrobiae bacterium]|nr:hypothetical protein [Verrucomicrobiae bacterium]
MEKLLEADWHFDAVPEPELAACCYWEYARESAFIREVRRRCMHEQQAHGQRDKRLHEDLQRIQSLGYPAYFFLHGFFCPPDGVLADALPLKLGEVHRLTGSFPKPWQLLTKAEREFRAYTPPRGLVDSVQLLPFERGIPLDAKDIVEMVAQQRRLIDEANARARLENPELNDEVLARLGKLRYSNVPASVIYGSGTEHTVVQICWGVFTNEEIIQEFRKWVKTNRPQDIPGPDGKGRNKARDWRVALERLGMMRLLHHFSKGELEKKSPKAWQLYRKREWYKERKRADEMFHRLFPFLASSERPLNWPTRGGHSK